MGFCVIHTVILQGRGACKCHGGRDTEESCVIMMLIILFLVSCQNLKHESWALKGWKQKGAVRGQEDLEGFVPWGARGMWAQQILPATSHGALAGTAPIFTSQQGPKSSFAPSRESWEVEGTGTAPWATWAPRQLFVKAGKGREAPLLPVPYWGRTSPATSPLLSPFTSLKARLVILIIKP